MAVKRTFSEIKDNKTAYLCLLPSLILLVAIIGYPLIKTIILSFYFNTLTQPWKGVFFVGLDNYSALFNDPGFWKTLRLTLIWTISSVALKTLLGLCGALLLNQKFTGRSMFRTLILPPWIIPLSIGAFVWKWLYNGQHGLLNGILLRFGIIDKPFEVLAYRTTAFIGCLINDVWVGVPFMTLVILAGLQAIPNELYEAANIDGANLWQNFCYITLPQLKTVLLIVTLLSTVWTFNSFDIIWVLTGGGPVNATTILVIKTFKVAFKQFHFGLGSALAVITFIVLSLVSVMYARFVLREK